MKDPIPQDPSPRAAKLRALKHATPFQAFAVTMVTGDMTLINRPEYLEVTDDGTCVKVSGPNGLRCVLALEWVIGIEVGGEVGTPPRGPRYTAKLRGLQERGPFGPLVLTMKDGRRFPLSGPHAYLLSSDGRSVAVCDREGFLILETADITDLAPGT